jgi:hypothetical protein
MKFRLGIPPELMLGYRYKLMSHLLSLDHTPMPAGLIPLRERDGLI